MDSGKRQSAYGLTFRLLPPVAELFSTCETSDPEVTICTGSDGPPPDLYPLDECRNVRCLPDGRILALERQPASATFFGPPLASDLLAHPYLAPVATTFSRWAGREAFHAGAFVSADRAWAVLGPRTAGKSTLLAAMAARGVPVLSDDIVVSDGAVVFQGPRCIDLREPLPGGGLDVRPSRRNTRWRAQLPGGAPRVPLGGWIFLKWGAALTAHHLGPSAVIRRLAPLRAGPDLPSDPAMLLALATLPAWDLVRPRDWGVLDATVYLIDCVVQGAPGVATP